MVNLSDENPRDDSRGYVWIKIRTNLIDNPKFMQLPDQAKSTYFELYLLAGKSDAFGLVLAGDGPATVQDLAWILRKPEPEMQNTLDELQRAGFVNLDGGVTVTKFASEQGPTMANQRRQWALRQAKRRALAKGQTWIEPDANTDTEAEKEKEVEPEKEKNKDTEQELKTTTKTKTKRVTQTSRESHAGVTRDNGFNEEVVVFADDFLELWTNETGKHFSKNDALLAMVQEWISYGVTMNHVQKGIQEYAKVAGADTPMYLRNIVLSLRDNEPDVQAQKNLERFRQLYREKKQAGGDNDVHE
jgi:hypothetical protein